MSGRRIWRSAHPGMNTCPAMEAHLSKYRSLIPSLALDCHLADGVHGDVTLTSFTRAAAWAEHLESHARRVYAAAVSAHIVAARSLAQHIQAGDLPNPFALRDAYRRQWSGLTGPDETSAAATMLVDIDWLRPETTPTQGRHKVVYLINPASGGPVNEVADPPRRAFSKLRKAQGPH